MGVIKLKNKRVSIALATYNGGQFIIPLLDSLRKQTYPIDEVIICDDDSQDHTVDKILEFMHRYQLNHWKVFVNKENLGYKRNFKEVLKKVSGDYVFLCDQDDVWDIHKVENIMNIFIKIPNAKCINTSYQCINEKGENIDSYSFMKQNLEENEIINIPFEDILISNISMGCTMAVKKEIKDLYLYYTNSMAAHDWELNCIASLNQGLYYYNRPLIRHRLVEHKSNEVHSDNLKKMERKKKCLETDCLLNSLHVYDEYLSTDHLDYLNECISFSRLRVLLLSDHQTKNWLELMKHFSLYRKYVSTQGIFYDLISSL